MPNCRDKLAANIVLQYSCVVSHRDQSQSIQMFYLLIIFAIIN